MSEYSSLDSYVITHSEFTELKRVVVSKLDCVKSGKVFNGCVSESKFILNSFRKGRRINTKNKVIMDIVDQITSSLRDKRDLYIYISLIVIDYNKCDRINSEISLKVG